MVLTEKTLDDILNYLDNSVAKLAKDTLNNHEFQMNDGDLDQFLSSQYDVRLIIYFKEKTAIFTI